MVSGKNHQPLTGKNGRQGDVEILSETNPILAVFHVFRDQLSREKLHTAGDIHGAPLVAQNLLFDLRLQRLFFINTGRQGMGLLLQALLLSSVSGIDQAIAANNLFFSGKRKRPVQGSQRPLFQPVVGVQKIQIGSPTKQNALLPRPHQTFVFLVMYPDSVVFFLVGVTDVSTAVFRAVVHQNDLQIPQTLRKNGGDALVQISFRPVNRNNDTDGRTFLLQGSSPFPSASGLDSSDIVLPSSASFSCSVCAGSLSRLMPRTSAMP